MTNKDRNSVDKSRTIYKQFTTGKEIVKEYNYNGQILRDNTSREFKQRYKYNDQGKLIHCKCSSGFKYWYDYDDQGRTIHYYGNDGRELWYKYANFQRGTVECVINNHGFEEYYFMDMKGNHVETIEGREKDGYKTYSIKKGRKSSMKYMSFIKQILK